MTDQTSSSGGHDLRAPIIVSLSRGLGIGWLRIIAFILLDSILIYLGWKTATFIVSKVERLDSVPQEPGFIWAILIITLGTLVIAGLYGERNSRRKFGRLIKCLTLAQIFLVFVGFLSTPNQLVFSRSTFLLSWLSILIFVLTGRLVFEGIIIQLRRTGRVTRKIFLIGTPKDTLIARISLKIISNREFEIAGDLDLSRKQGRHLWSNNLSWAKTLQGLTQQGVGEVFVCSWQSIDNPMDFYWTLKSAGIHMRILPIGLEIPNFSSNIEMLGGMPTIHFIPPMLVGSDFWFKRIFDLVVASLILVVASPVFITIALIIKLDSPGPIFFKQTRIGLRNQKIKVWKFRTMVIDAEKLLKRLETQNEIKGGVLFKMKDDPRITKVGKFLRRYSLDELPQLINVMIGEMSLVGPRPLPLRDVENFSGHHFARHNVLPGITGLWQVSGRSDINDFEYAYKLDATYIQNWSLALDFQILLKTVQVVLANKGAY